MNPSIVQPTNRRIGFSNLSERERFIQIKYKNIANKIMDYDLDNEFSFDYTKQYEEERCILNVPLISDIEGALVNREMEDEVSDVLLEAEEDGRFRGLDEDDREDLMQEITQEHEEMFLWNIGFLNLTFEIEKFLLENDYCWLETREEGYANEEKTRLAFECTIKNSPLFNVLTQTWEDDEVYLVYGSYV